MWKGGSDLYGRSCGDLCGRVAVIFVCGGQVRHGEGCVATRAFAEGEVRAAVICMGEAAVICTGEAAVIRMDALDGQVVLQELPALGLQTPPSRVQVLFLSCMNASCSHI